MDPHIIHSRSAGLLGQRQAFRKIFHQPKFKGFRRFEQQYHLPFSHPAHLVQSSGNFGSVVESKSSQGGIKCLITEGQRLGHSSNSSASPCGPLSNHLKGWLNQGNNTVSGLVIAAAGAYVDNSSGITQ